MLCQYLRVFELHRMYWRADRCNYVDIVYPHCIGNRKTFCFSVVFLKMRTNLISKAVFVVKKPWYFTLTMMMKMMMLLLFIGHNFEHYILLLLQLFSGY